MSPLMERSEITSTTFILEGLQWSPHPAGGPASDVPEGEASWVVVEQTVTEIQRPGDIDRSHDVRILVKFQWRRGEATDTHTFDLHEYGSKEVRDTTPGGLGIYATHRNTRVALSYRHPLKGRGCKFHTVTMQLEGIEDVAHFCLLIDCFVPITRSKTSL